MSIVYSIEVKLDVSYSKDIVCKILAKGKNKGFIYYDKIINQDIDNPLPILPEEAAVKLIQAQELLLDLGPRVLTILGGDDNASLWFYKNDDGTINIDMGAFGCPRKKGNYIDFSYYIRMMLDLCDDFPIIELKTNMI